MHSHARRRLEGQVFASRGGGGGNSLRVFTNVALCGPKVPLPEVAVGKNPEFVRSFTADSHGGVPGN